MYFKNFTYIYICYGQDEDLNSVDIEALTIILKHQIEKITDYFNTTHLIMDI